MDITELCSNRREALTELWVNRFFATYPLDSKGFMRTKRDRFANPVGETTRMATGILLDAVIGMDADPAVVNRDAYGEGWLVKVKMSNPAEYDALLGAADYEKLIG